MDNPLQSADEEHIVFYDIKNYTEVLRTQYYAKNSLGKNE